MLERSQAPAARERPTSDYYALAADVRTHVAAMWQVAAELAQADTSFEGDEHRLRLLESLKLLLDALSFLDVAVDHCPKRGQVTDQGQTCRDRYVEAAAHAERTVAAADALAVETHSRRLVGPAHRLQVAAEHLRRHVTSLGSLVTEWQGNGPSVPARRMTGQPGTPAAGQTAPEMRPRWSL